MEVVMTITRSYNKHTDTYYAYDTTYVWDEKTQRKVQKKRCIGKIDPETDEIIPTGKRGRPRREKPLSGTRKLMIMPNMRKFFLKPECSVQG